MTSWPREAKASATVRNGASVTKSLMSQAEASAEDAIAELEALDSRVEGLRDDDYVGACRLLLGAKEGV